MIIFNRYKHIAIVFGPGCILYIDNGCIICEASTVSRVLLKTYSNNDIAECVMDDIMTKYADGEKFYNMPTEDSILKGE